MLGNIQPSALSGLQPERYMTNLLYRDDAPGFDLSAFQAVFYDLIN